MAEEEVKEEEKNTVQPEVSCEQVCVCYMGVGL